MSLLLSRCRLAFGHGITRPHHLMPLPRTRWPGQISKPFQARPYGNDREELWRLMAQRINLRKWVVWPFWAINGLVFAWWALAEGGSRKRVYRVIEPISAISDPSRLIRGRITPTLDYMYKNFTLTTENIREGRWWTLLSSTVSHRDPLHLLFNMISFNAMASCAVFTGLSVPTLLTLGVGSGIVSSTAQLLSPQMMNKEYAHALGASGIVSGFVTAMALARPYIPMQFMFIPIGVPLWVIALGYFAYDTYRLNDENSIIGHAAHVGGAGFGAIFYLAVLRRRFGGL
ncbi:hypothetical protein F4778DRAFT_615498 [Xylariomycetidae sp. FL2044]|nr:hypothetical protein F4778DRAFT_615498 [Xylariomycetidae sp. FL2044]